MKKICLFVLMLILPISVFARAKTSCDYSLMSKLKKYASNVNIIYDYRIENNEAYYNITISNLVPDIYVVDETFNNTYRYTNGGEVVIPNIKNTKKIKYKILSANAGCPDEVLLTQYIKLPVYNKYSTDPLCDGLENYKLCYTFLDTDITYDEFKKKIEAYKNKKPVEEEVITKKKNIKSDWDKFLDFMLQYGIYIAAAIAIIITIISVRRSRKNKFDFKL